ncbi:MAG: hypothetical protein CNLJKLNK_00910 [Holosporales bacterium]
MVMKKKTHIKTQSALVALALSLAVVNAAEQNASYAERSVSSYQGAGGAQLTKEEFIRQLLQGVSVPNRSRIIEESEKVDPDRCTNAFIKTVNELLQGMNNAYKAIIIKAVAQVNPDRYADFIKVVNLLSQGLLSNDKASAIMAIASVHPNRYTDFTDIINLQAQGMLSNDKAKVIKAIASVHPNRYTDFTDIINLQAQGMLSNDKAKVIKAIASVHPDRYADFINMLNVLLEGMDNADRAHVIVSVSNIHSDHYADFINMVNVLLQRINGRNKASTIATFGNFYSDYYAFLQNFTRQNPSFFTYVPVREFNFFVKPGMTQQQLQELLESLHRQYYRQAPAGTPVALAFEIHNFANQTVVGETGEKQRFNQAVLNHLQRSIQGPVLAYDVVLDLLRAELATLKSDPLKSNAIDEEVYNWVIQANKDMQDKNAIATVVTYLEQKDNTHGKLRTWLYAFMDESKKAYDGKNTQSCIKGVKERVITSLRSAVPEGDSALENLFHQAEAPFMLAAKSKRLTDYAFWAKKLEQKGVTSSSSQDEAKIKFKEALVDYFAGIMDVRVYATIDATLDSFDDSKPDSDDASLKLAAPGDGLWSKIKLELIKLEQGTAKKSQTQ